MFALRLTRKATALAELLGEAFGGIVTCDRAKMYWRVGRLQWCWAHLKRDFQALIDQGDNQVKRLGHDLRAPDVPVVRALGPITATGQSRARHCYAAWVRSARRSSACCCAVCIAATCMHGMCRELYDHRHWLWTFLRHEGVEPTNNASERALRHAVIWRKLSFGTQSAGGSRFVETMLTVIETCRQQRRQRLCLRHRGRRSPPRGPASPIITSRAV